jgi:hypothetical protein
MDDIHVEVASGASLSVLNPMGYPPKITKRSPAPRLDTLTRKTIQKPGRRSRRMATPPSSALATEAPARLP